MLNTGKVIQAEGGMLTVVFDRPEACGECHACARGSESCAKHTLQIEGDARPGDWVEVEIDESHMLMASAVAYLIPLAGLIIGLAAGWAATRGNEPVMALCALLGVAAGYFIMRSLNPRFGAGRWQPRIVSVESAEAHELKTIGRKA